MAGRLLPLLFASLLTPVARADSDRGDAAAPAAVVRADFRVLVDTVLLNVGVYSPEERIEIRLKPSDFVVYEDGIPRQITYFAPANTPLSVVLLVDCSQSMSIVALAEAKKAASEFVRQSHPETQFSIVAFNEKVKRTLDFTTDRLDIESSLSGLQAHGGTRLYDGIREAIENWDGAQNRARAIVLLTDGRDEMSDTQLADVELLLEKNDIILFPCGIYSPAYRRLFLNDQKYYIEPAVEKNLNPAWVLRHFAEICGTEALFPEPGKPLSEALAGIISELQHRYLVGFEPGPSLLPGARYRAVEVQLKNRSDVRVQTRKGYVR